MPVQQSELDDAYNELRKCGYDESSFTFTPTTYKHLGPGVGPLVGDIAVVNTLTGHQKTYDTGHGTSWPAEFADDLRTGVFGTPPPKR